MADQEMSKIEEVNQTAETEEKEENTDLLIQFKKSYRFEGKDYTELDLNGLRKLTIKDAIDAQRSLFNERETAGMQLSETSTAFARLIAEKATGLPSEFFKLARIGVSRSIWIAVLSFIGANREVVDHVMTFDKPYIFNGAAYTEVDLSKLESLTSMNQSSAENRLVQEGFSVADTSNNYLYLCCMASMATGYPEEFFTGLPLSELLKLKLAVNDPDFFE